MLVVPSARALFRYANKCLLAVETSRRCSVLHRPSPRWLFSRTTFYHLLSPSASAASFAAMHGVASYFFLHLSACLFSLPRRRLVSYLFEFRRLPTIAISVKKILPFFSFPHENCTSFTSSGGKMFQLAFRVEPEYIYFTHLSRGFFPLWTPVIDISGSLYSEFDAISCAVLVAD